MAEATVHVAHWVGLVGKRLQRGAERYEEGVSERVSEKGGQEKTAVTIQGERERESNRKLVKEKFYYTYQSRSSSGLTAWKADSSFFIRQILTFSTHTRP